VGPPSRRRAVELCRDLGYEAWARLTGYGQRWAVETAYSTFKRLFGEHSLAIEMAEGKEPWAGELPEGEGGMPGSESGLAEAVELLPVRDLVTGI
jgi:hypothetical protein